MAKLSVPGRAQVDSKGTLFWLFKFLLKDNHCPHILSVLLISALTTEPTAEQGNSLQKVVRLIFFNT